MTMRDIYEQSAQHWPKYAPLLPRCEAWVKAGMMLPVIGTGPRWMLKDGTVVHLIQLGPCLTDGWTPRTLVEAKHAGNYQLDTADFDMGFTDSPPTPNVGNALADIAVSALTREAQARAKTVQASAKGNRDRQTEAAQRRALVGRFLQPGDSAAMVRRRIERETGEILRVDDRTLRRDIKLIRTG